MAAQSSENYQLYKRYIKNIAVVYNSRKDIRAYVELMLSISVIVIFGIFAIRPTLVTIAELQKEIQEKETTLSLLETKLSNLDVAQKLINENRRSISLLDTAVPDGPLPVTYARQIEGLTRRNETQLFGLGSERVTILGKSVTPTDVDQTETSDRYPTQASSMEFNINIRGNYLNIKNFISEIEKLRRPIFIEDVRMTPEDNRGQGALILTLIGRVPFLSN